MKTNKVCLVDKYDSGYNYTKHFQFPIDMAYLCDSKIKKVKKENITLDIDTLTADYDFIITVGADVSRNVAKCTKVTDYQGYLLEGKFLPIVSPVMVKLKPEAKPAFDKSIEDIHGYVLEDKVGACKVNISYTDNSEVATAYVDNLLEQKVKVIAVDCETTSLYPRDGNVLGISLSSEEREGIYMSADCITEELEAKLQELFNQTYCVFHNSKFDTKFLGYHFNFKFPKVHDTLIMHYLLDENSAHGLKSLALKYTELGDYDRGLEQFKRDYCKTNKIKVGDFSYDLIPFHILGEYAAYDTAATIELFNKFYPYLKGSVSSVYNNIMMPGSDFLAKVENNGIPFSKTRLRKAQGILGKQILQLEQELYKFDAIKDYEELNKVKFNVNSPAHMRDVLFSSLGLSQKVATFTDTGALCTNAEVLADMEDQHPLVAKLLELKKAKKIKSTYIDKIIPNLNMDSRLRTNFNQAVTTSGRLSSSGKLNAQQLPRDNKIVKACIEAREGYVIVSQDLATAEMYVAAVLSGDMELQSVFTSGGDFHSTVAKMVFNLPCKVSEVKKLYGELRQGAKAVSFGILYGSGPAKVAESVNKEGGNMSLEEAKDVIKKYFAKFKKLASWLKSQQSHISQHGHIYSAFGRKRRLPNVNSSSSGEKGHAVRSGVNFLVQSVASDINLIAGIEAQKYIEENNLDVKIFGLVHDSILAEVRVEHLEEYSAMLKRVTQADMGVSIPGYPIGVDLEVGPDYSFLEDVEEVYFKEAA